MLRNGVVFCEGIRLPIAVGGLGGDGVSSVVKGDGHVYGEQCILCSIWHIHSLRICRIFIPWFIFIAFWFSGRLFHNQRLSFSSLELRNGREFSKPRPRVFYNYLKVCVRTTLSFLILFCFKKIILNALGGYCFFFLFRRVPLVGPM